MCPQFIKVKMRTLHSKNLTGLGSDVAVVLWSRPAMTACVHVGCVIWEMTELHLR